jgi:UDP-N-acetylglucosamine pyrophosphorylase
MGKILDPVYIGYAKSNSLSAAIKTVGREDDKDSVSVVAVKNGVTGIIESSELPAGVRNKRHPSTEPAGYFYTPPPGPYFYNNGNMSDFLIDATFLMSMNSEHDNNVISKYSKATKKVEFFDLSLQQQVQPAAENGYVFELNVHSFLQHVPADKLGVFQVDRATEFSPITDKDGVSRYCPSNARKQILDEATQWLSAVPNIKLGYYAKGNVEISFLYAYRGETMLHEDIAAKLVETEINAPGYITHLGDYQKK